MAVEDNKAALTAVTDWLNDVRMHVRGAAMGAIPYFSLHVNDEGISALAAACVGESQKQMQNKALAALIKLAVAGHEGAMASIVTHPRPCVRRAAIAAPP